MKFKDSKELKKRFEKYKKEVSKSIETLLKKSFEAETKYFQKFRKLEYLSISLLVAGFVLLIFQVNIIIPVYGNLSIHFVPEIWNALLIFGTVLLGISFIYFQIIKSLLHSLHTPFVIQEMKKGMDPKEFNRGFRDFLHKEIKSYEKIVHESFSETENKDKQLKKMLLMAEYVKNFREAKKNDDSAKMYDLTFEVFKKLKKI